MAHLLYDLKTKNDWLIRVTAMPGDFFQGKMCVLNVKWVKLQQSRHQSRSTEEGHGVIGGGTLPFEKYFDAVATS